MSNHSRGLTHRDIDRMMDQEIRFHHEELGAVVGPVTDATRNVYKKKLFNLSNNVDESNSRSWGDDQSRDDDSFDASPSQCADSHSRDTFDWQQHSFRDPLRRTRSFTRNNEAKHPAGRLDRRSLTPSPPDSSTGGRPFPAWQNPPAGYNHNPYAHVAPTPGTGYLQPGGVRWWLVVLIVVVVAALVFLCVMYRDALEAFAL